MRHYKEQRDLAVKLRAEAKRLGEQLMALGQALSDAPESVAFPGHTISRQLAHEPHQVKEGSLDQQRLKVLVEDYRKAILKRDEAADQLRSMGINLADFQRKAG